MYERIRQASLRDRVTDARRAAGLIGPGMVVAFGGYTSMGYPKAIPAELGKRQEAGEDLALTLLTGSTAAPVELLMGKAVKRQMPMIESRTMSSMANQGQVHYVEQQMGKMARMLHYGFLPPIDVGVIEATAITGEGFIVPGPAIGAAAFIARNARQLIIEVNEALPLELEGFHDIYAPGIPPHMEPIPLRTVNGRIGEAFLRAERIAAIVMTNEEEQLPKPPVKSEVTEKITENLLDFLELEALRCGWGKRLPPVQTGFGNLAAHIASALEDSRFEDISFFCGALQEANITMLLNGKVTAASAGSLQMTPRVIELIRSHGAELKRIAVLRNMEITNNPETTSRMGIIALNSAIEADIYGNANSSHIMGSRVVNGLGGGANFAQSAALSVLLIPSEAKGGAISTIVPMVSHHDIIEHDVDVLITDQGVADLRGLDDVERARAIIENCAGGTYRGMLLDYLERAIAAAGGHHPILLEEALSWHLRLKQTGSMLKD